MTTDFSDYGNYDLGAEGYVSPDRGENDEINSNTPSGISTVPSSFKGIRSIKRALTGAFKNGLRNKNHPPSNLPPPASYRPENLGDPHFPMPDDFVPQTSRARMDPPLPEDYNPHDRWNFDKK